MVLSILGNDLTHLQVYTQQLSEQMCSKCKVPVLNQTLPHKGAWGSGRIVPCIINLIIGWRWVVSFMPQPLKSPGKSLQYPLNRRLGGPQTQSCCFGEDKNLLAMPGIDP
jgi:hypothetical protein